MLTHGSEHGSFLRGQWNSCCISCSFPGGLHFLVRSGEVIVLPSPLMGQNLWDK